MSNKTKSETSELPFIVTNKALSMTLLGLIIFTVSGITWWNNIHNSPRRVFEGMLKTSLSTSGVSRSTSGDDQGSSIKKTEQLSFVPDMATRTVVDIKQQTEAGDTHVISETIGTQLSDYSRYIKIDNSQKTEDGRSLDYSGVTNVWGHTPYPQAYQQSMLGLIPFANLEPGDVDKILDDIKNKQVYTVDYSKVEPRKVGERSALVIPVKINMSAYVEVIKSIAKQTGLGSFDDLNPEDYADGEPIEVNLVIDKMTRQLIEAEYVGSEQKETYSSYGLISPIEVPKDARPIEELQQKIQEIQ